MSKAASARRERGNYGKVNLGQVPNDVTDGLNGSKGAKAGTDEDEIDSSIKESSEVVAGHRGPSLNMHHRAGLVAGFKGYLKVFHQCRDLLKVSTYIPGSSYEVMRIELDFDPLDISALTGFHIGRPAVQTLKEKPETLKEVLKCRQWSYFNYLPKHYGESACLDDAVHCIAVRVRRYLKGSDVVPDRSVMHYYTTALRSLQSSLDDPARRLDPDVLCATEILAIYEVHTLVFNLTLAFGTGAYFNAAVAGFLFDPRLD